MDDADMDRRLRRLRTGRPRSCSALAALLFAVGGGASATAASVGARPHGQDSALGAHTLLTQPDGEGSNPAVSSAITTQETGSSLLVLVGGYVSNASAPIDTYGNRWMQQGPRIVYHAYQARFDTAAYVVLAAKGGRGHRVSLAKNGTAAGEITAPFIEIKHAGVLQDAAYNYAVAGAMARLAGRLGRVLPGDDRAFSSAELTSGEVTTTGPATLVAVWWGDAFVYAMTAVPDGGFKVIERFLDLPRSSGVQCAVAVKQVDRAGAYRVTWKGTPAQGAILWLFAFQSKG
jgi:hypothetical protein